MLHHSHDALECFWWSGQGESETDVDTTALVIVVALMAAGAGKLARMDGATYPAAFTRAAVTLAAVVTLATTVAGTFIAFSLDHPAMVRFPLGREHPGPARRR